MEIKRQQEMVESFHYDANHGNEVADTKIDVELSPLEPAGEEAELYKDDTILGVRVNFKIIFPEFILNGAVSQIVNLPSRKVESAEDCTAEELDDIIRPLFSLVERLTYEITEVALDKPGVQINFNRG